MASIFDLMDDSNSNQPKISTADMKLFRAAASGDFATVSTMLQPNQVIGDPSTLVNGLNAFHIAVKKGHCHIVDILIKSNGKLIQMLSADGRNPVMIAAYERKLEILSIIHDNIDPTLWIEAYSQCDPDGNTAFHYASWGGSIDCVKYLIQNCKGSLEEIEELISRGNRENLSPLQFAVAGKHVELISYLSSITKSAEADSSLLGYNAIHRAVMYGSMESLEVLLSSNPSNIHATSSNGSTILHLASQHGYLDIIKLLCERLQFDVNAQNEYGLTPLMFACIGGYTDIVEYLLSLSANIFLTNGSGAQALHLAASNGKSNIVRILSQQKNIDLFCRDFEGRTPIEEAISSGFKGIASQIAYHSCVQHYTQVTLPILNNYFSMTL